MRGFSFLKETIVQSQAPQVTPVQLRVLNALREHPGTWWTTANMMTMLGLERDHTGARAENLRETLRRLVHLDLAETSREGSVALWRSTLAQAKLPIQPVLQRTTGGMNPLKTPKPLRLPEPSKASKPLKKPRRDDAAAFVRAATAMAWEDTDPQHRTIDARLAPPPPPETLRNRSVFDLGREI